MNIRELKEKLSSALEDGVAESAEAVERDSRPSRSLITEKPSPRSESSGDEEIAGTLRHCRSCKHLRVSQMPTVPTAGRGFLVVDAQSRDGKRYTLQLERVEGDVFAVCSLNNWDAGPGTLANPEQMKSNHGYFRDQADLCADYEMSGPKGSST